MNGLNNAISANHAATANGPISAALDFGIRGIRAAVFLRSGLTAIPLVDEGLSPASLLTFKGGDRVPAFPNLLDRLGEDCPVSFDHIKSQKPHLHLRDLFGQVHASLRAWWGPSSSLALVVSAYANDLQRGLMLRSASASGWAAPRLVNKTTALAIHALQQKSDGKYLSLVLGHGPAEASVLQWDDRRLQAISYSIEPGLSGDELDRSLLQKILANLEPSNNVSRSSHAYALEDWMWMRERAEQIRHRLSFHSGVIVEMPASLTGGSPQDMLFEHKNWEQELSPLLNSLADLINRCCREAGVTMDELDGFCASGGLLMQAAFRNKLAQLCQGHVDTYGPDAQLLGACELAHQEEGETTKATNTSLEHPPEVAEDIPFRIRANHDDHALSDKSAVERPSSQSTVNDPQIQKLEASIQELEGGLQRAREILGKLRRRAARSSSKLDASTSHVSIDVKKTVPSPAAPKAGSLKQQREYMFAEKCLRQAETLLQAGHLEEAVGLSHQAMEASRDSRIFGTVIDIHLRAASARPPAPETFPEDRRWLLCALSDHGTNEKVQKALAHRFFTHAKQMLSLGTEQGKAQAIVALNEMLEDVPLAEEAQEAIRLLQENSSDNSI